jgi:MSHA pilin protein MshA
MKQPKLTPFPLVNNAGFTLLEIIAVIVIMGILAVVAVPRYFDLQDQARNRAFGAGVAEATGRINSYFAQRILMGDRPNDINYTNDTIGTDLGDFSIDISNGGGGDPPNATITIVVTGTSAEMSQVAPRTITIPRPGGL